MFNLNEITQIVEGKLYVGADNNSDPQVPVELKVTIDSRETAGNNIFIAIVGENNDGHNYVDSVVENNIGVVLISNPDYITSKAHCVLVDDTVLALGKLAKKHLQTLNTKTVGITGSAGKTTTKDLLAQLLRENYGEEHVVFPEKSFNNEIGMPLTVLKANANTKMLILELGASAVGDLKYLVDIAPLDYAIVLFVGTAHLGGFGSFQKVVEAKSELVEGLKVDGLAILNADDENVANMSEKAPGRVAYYSAQGKFCDLWAENIELDDKQYVSFDLCSPATKVNVSLPLVGEHNVVNALAAFTLMQDLGVELQTLSENMGAVRVLSQHRLHVEELENGALIIDDAYNANLDSMRAGVKCLADMGQKRLKNLKGKTATSVDVEKTGVVRTVAVLGQMLELGEQSYNIHRELAEYINECGIDVVITVGDEVDGLADNLTVKEKHSFGSILDVEKIIGNFLTPKDIVLFKGSNGSRVWELAGKVLGGQF